VAIGNYCLKQAFHRIELDMMRVGALLGEYLVTAGHRMVAFAAEHLHPAYEHQVFLGARDYIERHGGQFPESRRIITGHYSSTGAEFIDPLLRMNPRPTALITTDSRAANDCVLSAAVCALISPSA
jgi:DNA-binding LacI/PurR family transcriptional regulator